MAEHTLHVTLDAGKTAGMAIDALSGRFAGAFAEWQRRYRDDPSAFEAEWAAMPAAEYGAQAAAYFVKLLREAGNR